MKSALTLSALLLLSAVPARTEVHATAPAPTSQLLGLRNPGDGGRQLVAVDPTTGAITTISASISPPLPSASGVAALDAVGHRFFFIATPTGETDSRIYTVNTQTGAVVTSPTIVGSATQPFLGLEYDTDDGALLGLRTAGGAGKQLVTLNPATAAVTPVSAATPTLAMSSGNTALDSIGNRFFFVATPAATTIQSVYTIDSHTGATLSSATLVGSDTAPVLDLQYDDGENVLFASRNPGDAGRQVVRLNPSTGAITPVSASISPPLGTSSGVTALDAAGDRFFLIGTPATDWRLYTVSTATGAVLSSPVVATGSAFFVALAYQPGPPPVRHVQIDIKPKKKVNKIQIHDDELIPVAILSDAGFDATTTNDSTVRFGPGAAKAVGRRSVQDVNHDGRPDLVLQFKNRAAAIPCGATSATLIGQTAGGEPFEGSDSVKVICDDDRDDGGDD